MERLKKLFDNPVFVKEMRVGFREKKVFFGLTAWVIIVAIFASISVAVALAESNNINDLPESGKTLFELLFWVQMALLAMLAPSLTTSAVSGERERQSFEMLLTTHLAPSELIFGKFGFAASFIVLSLFSTIPLESVVFFLGGVSLSSFLVSKLALLAFGLLCSLLGLMLSARETRSAYATGQTYLCLFLLSFTLGPFLGMMRYAPDIPFEAQALMVISIIYLGLFFFWKSVNHLEERASHLKMLLGIGLVFYIILIGIGLCNEELWGDLDDSIWAVYAPVHYLLIGIMLNPMRPTKQRERALFEKSRMSRPLYWAVLLCVGILLPNLYSDDFAFTAMSVYTVLASLGTALFARGLALRNPQRYPALLGASWLLLNLLPAFAGISGITDAERIWHPALISPFYYLVDSYSGHHYDVTYTAYGFYLGLLLLGLMLCLRKTKPKAEPTTDRTKS